jgi:hypothetical protein
VQLCGQSFRPAAKSVEMAWQINSVSAIYKSGTLKGSPMAKRIKRRAWTKENVRELKSLAKQKTPAAKIARSLKRTLGATRQKAFSLGVSLDSRG